MKRDGRVLCRAWVFDWASKRSSASQPQEPPRLALRSTPPCQGGEFLPDADQIRSRANELSLCCRGCGVGTHTRYLVGDAVRGRTRATLLQGMRCGDAHALPCRGCGAWVFDLPLRASQPQEPPRLALRSTPPCQGGEFLPDADCSAAELGLGKAIKTRFYGRRCLGLGSVKRLKRASTGADKTTFPTPSLRREGGS